MQIAIVTYTLDLSIQKLTISKDFTTMFQVFSSIFEEWLPLQEYYFALKSNLAYLFFRDYSLL